MFVCPVMFRPLFCSAGCCRPCLLSPVKKQRANKTGRQQTRRRIYAPNENTKASNFTPGDPPCSTRYLKWGGYPPCTYHLLGVEMTPAGGRNGYKYRLFLSFFLFFVFHLFFYCLFKIIINIILFYFVCYMFVCILFVFFGGVLFSNQNCVDFFFEKIRPFRTIELEKRNILNVG